MNEVLNFISAQVHHIRMERHDNLMIILNAYQIIIKPKIKFIANFPNNYNSINNGMFYSHLKFYNFMDKAKERIGNKTKNK